MPCYTRENRRGARYKHHGAGHTLALSAFQTLAPFLPTNLSETLPGTQFRRVKFDTNLAIFCLQVLGALHVPLLSRALIRISSIPQEGLAEATYCYSIS